MIVYCVTVHVKKEHVGEFIEATIRNHERTRREPGNVRFDVLQAATEPTQFLLYEVYESKAAVADHKSTKHYLAWRDAVADWMERPREGIEHQIIRPLEREEW